MIDLEWNKLCKFIAKRFDVATPEIESLLFLIGLQELQKFNTKFGKNTKLEIIHVSTCILLSGKGYYNLDYIDKDGWPHFKKVKSLPNYTPDEQTLFLKKLILEYFKERVDYL